MKKSIMLAKSIDENYGRKLWNRVESPALVPVIRGQSSQTTVATRVVSPYR